MERTDQRPLDLNAPMRLRRLEIEDFGLIARASVTFAAGLTVFSGETGSGKTMLLGALAFVLGARASPESIRRGAARMRVTLEVEADEALHALFAGAGFECEPGEDALLSREMTEGGKSSARVNGRLANAAQLRALGERIVDFVGQHEQQRLLSHGYQMDLLDRFGGDGTLELGEQVAILHARTAQLARELAEAQDGAGRALAEFEFAQFALREIDEAALRADEEPDLRARREYLANAERIATALAQAHEALIGSDVSATELLGSAAAALGGVRRFGEGLSGLCDALVALQSDVNEAAATLARELERTELDPAAAESISARLDLIDGLKRKYGGSLEAVLAERGRLAAVVEDYASRDERAASLSRQLAEMSDDLKRRAQSLTAARTQAARRLEKRVAVELRGLAMPSARFAVVLEPLGQISTRGAERVEYVLAPNAGEPLRSLAKAASGGELSRVLLALVVVLADRRERTALVFDEIDAGVGGATANAVALRLGALARSSQIVCVTHLAQIASWADTHYALRKEAGKASTQIDLVPLHESAVVREEIARMLSGNAASVALDHAETLLQDVRRKKAEEPATP